MFQYNSVYPKIKHHRSQHNHQTQSLTCLMSDVASSRAVSRLTAVWPLCAVLQPGAGAGLTISNIFSCSFLHIRKSYNKKSYKLWWKVIRTHTNILLVNVDYFLLAIPGNHPSLYTTESWLRQVATSHTSDVRCRHLSPPESPPLLHTWQIQGFSLVKIPHAGLWLADTVITLACDMGVTSVSLVWQVARVTPMGHSHRVFLVIWSH